jgi:hypothetical protein
MTTDNQINEGVCEIFRVVTAHKQREGVRAVIDTLTPITYLFSGVPLGEAGRQGVTATPACRPARRARSNA